MPQQDKTHSKILALDVFRQILGLFRDIRNFFSLPFTKDILEISLPLSPGDNFVING